MVDLLCQLNELRFLENHAHITWLIIALLFALLLLFLLVLWDDFKRWNTISVIVQLIIEMCMLWLMEDCIISHFNHPVQCDYSKSAKFENSWLAFFKCLKKVNSTLQNKGIQVSNKIVTKICAMLSLLTESSCCERQILDHVYTLNFHPERCRIGERQVCSTKRICWLHLTATSISEDNIIY